MKLSAKEVLSDKKGLAEALGMVAITMTLLIAAGTVVADYAIHSKQASELQSLRQEITNRAELYASDLNADLLTPQVPSTDRQCSSTTSMCTTILSVSPSGDGTSTVLRIQGDTVTLLGQSVTQDVTLVSSQVTHVTAIDADGDNVWALSNEGLRYTTWGVASAKPSDVTPAELAGPTAGGTWVSVDDRAGVDSAGALWVWGKNDLGQAGIGSTSATAVQPTKLTEGTTSFRSVVTDDDRAYAIDSTGGLWAWGKNDQGQLGLGTTSNVMQPTKVAGSRMMSVTVGEDDAFGITMSGDLVHTGAAQAGLSAPAGSSFRQVNAGTVWAAVAASTDGAVAMIDQAGNLTMAGSGYPFTPAPTVKFSSVSLGSSASYAISTDGDLYTWGLGTNGQLGQGTTTSASTPTQVMSGTKFVSVQGAKTSALAIDVTGALYYVGATPSGYVGGTDLPQVSVFTALMPGTQFRQIATNSGDTAAALVDTASNIYGMGTTTAGLWPMDYLGAGNQLIRMPVPEGFPSYTWK